MPEKTRKKSHAAPDVTESSGNVFADLGIPHPEQEMVKARLALQIYRIIQNRGLTQVEAARQLRIRQPHVSLLLRNRAGSFSVGKLMEFLTILGQDVEVTVRPAKRDHGRMSVMTKRERKTA